LAVDVVARGAPITDPQSVVRLASLGVLSGSGNLTAGGLLESSEQFECLSFQSADEDLVNLYERTKAEVRIPDKSGGTRPYVATRFKQSIDSGHKDGTIVTRVHGIVRKPTEGFDHLAKAGRTDLMVETLVLDESKRYHRLFSGSTKERARSNLAAHRTEHGEDETHG
jgi:hypothetical protein